MKKENCNALKKFAIIGSLFIAGTIGVGSFINYSVYKNKENAAKQDVNVMTGEINKAQKHAAWHGFVLGAILSGVTIGSVFKEERY